MTLIKTKSVLSIQANAGKQTFLPTLELYDGVTVPDFKELTARA